MFPINPSPCTLAEARQYGEENLRFTVGNLLRFMTALEQGSTEPDKPMDRV